MKTKTLKLSLLAFFSLFIFSCEEDSIEDPVKDKQEEENQNCPEISLDIKQRDGFDIKIFAKEIEGATYKWTVEKDGEAEETPGDPETPYTLSWGPSIGTVNFCVSISTENCPGEKYCTTFFATEAQFEEGNKSDAEISVVKNDNGIFTYDIKSKNTPKGNCELDATMIINYRKSNVIDPEIIGLEEIKGVVYEWSVNGETTTGNFEAPNELGWDPNTGTTKFCVKITTPDCKEGFTICEIVTVFDGDEDKALELDFENIKIEKDEEGVFLYVFPEEKAKEPKNKDCKKVDFVIEIRDGLDITVKAPIASLDYTYTWKVTTTYLDDRDPIISNNAALGDNTFGWGPSEGINEFCLTVTSNDCKEGITTCKKLIIPEGFSKNSLDMIDTKDISIRELPSGNYMFELVDKK